MPNGNLRKRRQINKTSKSGRRRSTKRETPLLQVKLDPSKPTPVALEDVLDEDFLTDLRDACESYGEPTFEIRDLLGWSDEQRFTVLSLIAGLECETKIQIHGSEEVFGNVFDAVLDTIEVDKNVERFENSKRAAIEAAVVVYPDKLDSACRQILNRFRELGVRGLQLHSLLRLAKNAIQDTGSNSFDDPKSAAEAFFEHVACQVQNSHQHPVLRYYRESIYRWTGTHYEKLADKQNHAQVVRFLQSHGQPEDSTERFARDVIANLQGMSLLDCWDQSTPLYIRKEEPLKVEPSPYAVFQNGRLNLGRLVQKQKAKLLTPTPANFSTTMLPFDYQRRAKCPLWQETVSEILAPVEPGDGRLQVLQEFMGWTLIAGDLSFQKFLIMVGSGANGKSTILTILRELLGAENVASVPLERFGAEFRLAEMIGKLANIASDMNRVERLEEGLLKELTSGDAIQVNRKYKSPISVVPTAKLIFATNILPPINDKSDGVWRRMIAMPFKQSFNEEDKDTDTCRVKRLREELPGIFNWAVEGARRLFDQGGFSKCSVCQQCADNHRYDSDPVMQFVTDECEFGEVCVPPQQLYSEHRHWCNRNGRKPVASSEFARRISELPGVTKMRPGSGDSRQRVWSGITVRPSVAKPN